ncbi:AAA family ATPase [Marinobacter salarius]|uniref:AAA family ATPase n=1 Tax=Marinobacter salarius TaxID=1420917 RepID=UPI003D9C07FD
MFQFRVIPREVRIPSSGKLVGYLKIDRWNDFDYQTMFQLSIFDEIGNFQKIGNIKIGFVGQSVSTPTHSTLEKEFERLSDKYFSIGDDVDYYSNLSKLSTDTKAKVLESLNDVVGRESALKQAADEDVFRTSLLRDTSLSIIKGQYFRVLYGKPALTDFEFSFKREKTEQLSEVSLNFQVEANSSPSTNIHAIIGRNGCGKTTILNGMIQAVTDSSTSNGKFIDKSSLFDSPISRDYFDALVSVSFSAFDPFSPPEEQPNPAKGTCYYYLGLKNRNQKGLHYTLEELQKNCVSSLINCFSKEGKKNRWLKAIDKLCSDENFAAMDLKQLESLYRVEKKETQDKQQPDSSRFQKNYYKKIKPTLSEMSSGHSIVLLTISKLVEKVDEKTLVLLDEPESHLHPPLLSAFTRALSDLLHDRNGVAIIATHSPVVLQEIPKSCVWVLDRIGSSLKPKRPNRESFGENVGVLTREVFGLETVKSGFHDLLVDKVKSLNSYDKVLKDFNGQLGLEGRAILKALTSKNEEDRSND